MEIQSLNQGNPVKRRLSLKYKNRERILRYIWDLYENGLLTMSRFFACVNHVTPAFNNDLVITNSAGIDRIMDAQAHNTGSS